MFDIDGTLVDSNFLHVSSWSRAFASIGHPADAWRIHAAIGMDSSKLLEAILGDDAERLTDEASDAHTTEYEKLVSELRAFDGARELLQTIADRGLRVVLATSAPDAELKNLRSVLDSEQTYYAVTSSEDVGTAKPEPDIIEVALEKGGVTADRAVMIGDTVWDVEAAGRAGVRCIGVRSGGVSGRELLAAGAVEVWDDAADLLANLDSSVIASL